MGEINPGFLVGVTTEGNPVLRGMFYFQGTVGLPLELVLFWLQQKNYVMDWEDWVFGAFKDGWNPKTIEARSSSAVLEIYGKTYHEQWSSRMEKLICSL